MPQVIEPVLRPSQGYDEKYPLKKRVVISQQARRQLIILKLIQTYYALFAF